MLELDTSSTASVSTKPDNQQRDQVIGIGIRSMQPNGTYDCHSKPQNSAAQHLSGILTTMATRALNGSRPSPRHFQIVDYGCSTGGNSLKLLEPVIKKLREQRANCSMQVVRCDLPSNDFNSLVQKVSEKRIACTRYFESMIASSFNRQILPQNSVHLGSCSLALHWVEGYRGSLLDDMINPEGTYSEFEIARAWVNQLRNFLSYRAREYASGGGLAICHLTRGATETNRHGPFRLLEDSIKKIGARDLARCQIPIYRPTFSCLQSALKECSHPDWEIKSTKELYLPNPLFEKYRISQNRTVLAREYVGFIQAFAQPTLEVGMPHLVGEHRRQMLNELFQVMQQQVLLFPENYEPQNTYSMVELIKR